jgi:hypothetical protein
MKNILICSAIMFFIIISAKPISAQDHGFGMGIILGEPTGLSAKLWTSSNNALILVLELD